VRAERVEVPRTLPDRIVCPKRLLAAPVCQSLYDNAIIINSILFRSIAIFGCSLWRVWAHRSRPEDGASWPTRQTGCDGSRMTRPLSPSQPALRAPASCEVVLVGGSGPTGVPIYLSAFDPSLVPQIDRDSMRIRLFVPSWTAHLSCSRVEQIRSARPEDRCVAWCHSEPRLRSRARTSERMACDYSRLTAAFGPVRRWRRDLRSTALAS
jgi:hypothetical protein